MVKAIESDATPSIYALHYNLGTWRVENLILIPRFAYSATALEKRKPLSAGARRAHWVGCNILLSAIPDSARIPVVLRGVPQDPQTVRHRFDRLKPLRNLRSDVRGWTLDVLKVVESLGQKEFGLSDVYCFQKHFQQLHPDNRHIQPKIRQQLQVLRDLGFLDFLGPGPSTSLPSTALGAGRAGRYRLR
jgi:type II restriction enzyme